MNNYKLTKLSNGIKVASERIDYVNSFYLGFWFNVGSRDETKATNGISHLLEHMFFKGTKKRSARRISEDIESLGGYLNAFTSKEHTCLYGRGMQQHLEKTFEVLSDMLQNSLFNKNELSKEAKVVIDELHDSEDSPEELIFDKFESNLFSGNSLGYPIIGTEKNIYSFTRDDLINYIRKHYTAENFYIVASGCVDHDKLVKLAEKYLKITSGNKKLRRKRISEKVHKDLFIYKDIHQTHLIVGGTTFGYNSNKRAVSNVLSNILGEGSSSRLFLSLREKNGIAYHVNTFMNSFYDVSTLGIYISTNESSIKKAKKLIDIELDKLKNKKVTEKELKRAKEYIKGHVQMSLESTTNRMMRMGSSLLYFNKFKTVEETMQEIDSVSREDLLDLSQKLFKPSKITSVLIASKNYFEK